MNPIQYKQHLLNQLYAPHEKCLQCPLGNLIRSQTVFGEGNPDANLMLVGEAPGQQEDRQGKPFVGRSGKLLDRIFEIIELSRDDIYITNVVKCRPPNNRRPTEQESTICKNILLYKQIQIIRPRVICTLGSAATESLLGEKVRITKIRGTQQSFKETIVIPTLHPAYILRNATKLKYLVSDLQTAKELFNVK